MLVVCQNSIRLCVLILAVTHHPPVCVITCSGLEVFLFLTRCRRQRGVRSVLLIDSLEVFM